MFAGAVGADDGAGVWFVEASQVEEVGGLVERVEDISGPEDGRCGGDDGDAVGGKGCGEGVASVEVFLCGDLGS